MFLFRRSNPGETAAPIPLDNPGGSGFVSLDLLAEPQDGNAPDVTGKFRALREVKTLKRIDLPPRRGKHRFAQAGKEGRGARDRQAPAASGGSLLGRALRYFFCRNVSPEGSAAKAR